MSRGTQRPPKQKKTNPIAFAIQTWLATLPPGLIFEAAGQLHSRHADDEAKQLQEQLINSAPKRWVAYDPMVLLPNGSFSSDLWKTLLRSADAARVSSLWDSILHEISKTSKEPLTRLAVNEGIPLKVSGQEGPVAGETEVTSLGSERENILRSPSGLRILHGDFGPDTGSAPSEEDFNAAFWVSTKQNGIHQVWAPRWTMFSRGNVKEKARLLDFHSSRSAAGVASDPLQENTRPALDSRLRPKSSLEGKYAVDLYAGIGYFVFSYARMGLRVLCWELNPWSVEGLRRGAVMNRWSVKVVQGRELDRPTAELVDGQTQIVVFLEDNREAERRTEELRRSGRDLDVLHINCGFLPSSIGTWRPAWAIQGRAGDGWLHLHENVGVADIDARRKEIQEMFDGWAQDTQDGRAALAEHVELVKTFAPDVWHCVFDVYVTAASSGGSRSSIT